MVKLGKNTLPATPRPPVIITAPVVVEVEGEVQAKVVARPTVPPLNAVAAVCTGLPLIKTVSPPAKFILPT